MLCFSILRYYLTFLSDYISACPTTRIFPHLHPHLAKRMILLRQSSVTLTVRPTRRLLRSASALTTLTLTHRPFHHHSVCSRMRVLPVPVRKDNYSYLIVDVAAREAAAVDPYTPSKVKEAAEQLGVKVVAGLTTHHHNDHSGGNEVGHSFLLSLSRLSCDLLFDLHLPVRHAGIREFYIHHSIACPLCSITSLTHSHLRSSRPSYSRAYRFMEAAIGAPP